MLKQEGSQPDWTRWTRDEAWPDHMYKGTGLFDHFLALLQVSGYFRLYFSTEDGFEHIGDYYHFEDLDDAAFGILNSTSNPPQTVDARQD